MLFIICLLLVGLPVLLAELAVGRGGRGNAASSFTRLSGSKLLGGYSFLTVLGAFLILSFYTVVAGWTLHYAMLSFTGRLFENSDYAGKFASFKSSWLPVMWQFIVIALTALIIVRGVSAGMEKFNKVLILGLVILLLALARVPLFSGHYFLLDNKLLLLKGRSHSSETLLGSGSYNFIEFCVL